VAKAGRVTQNRAICSERNQARLAPLSKQQTQRSTMAIQLSPVPLPASADPAAFADFGREVRGIDPSNLSQDQFKELEQALYKVAPIRPGSWIRALLTAL
jgi:hypothetical protein